MSGHAPAFTERGALSTTVEILRKIGCVDEADRLVMEAHGPSFKPDPKGGPPSDEHIVDRCKDLLIRHVSDVEPILEELLTKMVIQQESYDKINALPTSEEKMRELIDGHLTAVGSKDIFYDLSVEKQKPEHEDPRMSGSDDGHMGNVTIIQKKSSSNKLMVVTGSKMSPEGDWIKLEPEVNGVDAEDAPIYSLQSEAGNFECSVSGLRWVSKDKVSLKYQFGSWEEHMERLETLHYIPGGPLLDVKVIAGKLDEAHLPHWICTEDVPTILGKMAVLHIDTCGDVVEQVSEVTPSHVKLSQPIFSPRRVLMRIGFPVKINCKVLIYKTNKTFLTLHVYLIPRDPALQQTIEKNELSSGYKMIQKPYPEKSLKMRDRFILTADMKSAEIYPEKLKLIYEGSDPNFFEVFIENPDSHFQLTIRHESEPVWTCAIRKDDYQNTGDIQEKYEEELASSLHGIYRKSQKKRTSSPRSLLTRIGSLDEAHRLVMEARGPSFKPDPKGSPPSDEHIVDRCKDQLIQHVSDIEPILEELLTKMVIQQESYDKINALPTSKEKMRELLDDHLTAVGSKDIFYDLSVEKQKPEHEDPRMSGSDDGHVGNVVWHESGSFNKITIVTGSKMSPEVDWIKLEPEVNCVDAEDAPIYSLQSEAGNFECSVSGLRWVSKEKVSLKYQFGSWEEHMERLETLHYIPGGPLLDVTVIAGKLDEAHLPHWICTEDDPTILGKFAVLHIDTCGDVVEQVSGVTPSHVKLSQPIFSPKGVLMRIGFPVKINCKVLIYKTNKAFLTLHVYLIPHDPALQQTIEKNELSRGHKMIQKPYPEKSLKMRNRFILTADMKSAEISPEKLKLKYRRSDTNFFEVFIKNPGSHFELTISRKTLPVWTCAIRKDDYQNTGDIQEKYEEALARVRSKLVEKMSRELINQLLDDLLEDGVLNEGEKDSVLQENNTTADRARRLIDMVKNKGREAIRKMFTHLRSRDPSLSNQLGLPSGLPV